MLGKAFQEVHRITGAYIRNKASHDEKKKQHKERKREDRSEARHSEERELNTEDKLSKRESKQAKIKAKKHEGDFPDKPHRPLNAYTLFNKETMEKVRLEYPDLKQKELMSVSANLWKGLSDEEKKPYDDQYKKAKIQYQIALDRFF